MERPFAHGSAGQQMAFPSGIGRTQFKPRESRLLFAICKSCFWTASIIIRDIAKRPGVSSCPICSERDVSFIPIAHEKSPLSSLDHRLPEMTGVETHTSGLKTDTLTCLRAAHHDNKARSMLKGEK